MGTQQILLISLSVIIVGMAVSVGITMFNAQATSANRLAIISDMNYFAAQCMVYYKTPELFCGGGYSWKSEIDDIGVWLGFEYDKTTNIMRTNNGTYVLSLSNDVLTITGTGTEMGNDTSTVVSATLLITGSTCNISTSIIN